MNPIGVFLTSIVGLLAVFLYLSSSTHVDQQQQEGHAEMRCQKAQFDVSFAKKWEQPASDVSTLAQRAHNECAIFEAKRNESAEETATHSKDNEELKNTIGNMMR